MSDYIVVLFAKRLRHPPPYVTHLLPTYPPNRLLGQVTVANNHLRHHARVSCYCIYIYVYLILCFRQGLSSVLDAASRGVATKPKSANKQPLPPSDNSNDDVDGPDEHRTKPAPDDSAETRAPENRSSTNDKKKGKDGNPDPFERIETVALSSLSGALKILSAAVGGVGEAVFQTGTVAEGLAGGTGQVAGEMSKHGLVSRSRSMPSYTALFIV